MSEQRIKPVQTAATEYWQEPDAESGEPTTVCREHYRQGDRYYSITWRVGAEPVVADEPAPAAAEAITPEGGATK